jgi:hypothetical protein
VSSFDGFSRVAGRLQITSMEPVNYERVTDRCKIKQLLHFWSKVLVVSICVMCCVAIVVLRHSGVAQFEPEQTIYPFLSYPFLSGRLAFVVPGHNYLPFFRANPIKWLINCSLFIMVIALVQYLVVRRWVFSGK